ncbi:MAG TPA: glycosyltransferase family 2 protein [Anaerolineales bacterium]
MSEPPEITVSIIIVNYNAGPLLAQCIRSVLAQTFQQFEIIVIDNASWDGSSDSLPEDGRIRLERNRKNLGFARAQNQGMLLAWGRYLMPLNFDILLAPDFLQEMVAAMELSERIGTVSPKLLRMADKGQKDGRIDNAGLLLPSDRLPRHRGLDEQDAGQFDRRVRVFGAMGAAALYRREMLEDIAYKGQFFDESFFMWYEDIDLDWRARLRGWDCLYTPQAVAYHIGDPHGHGKSAFGAQTSMRNRWMMILANECPSCFVHHFGEMVRVELGLFNHVVKHNLIGAYLRAVVSLLRQSPGVWRKRRWVRGRAQQPCLPEYPQPF